MLERTGKNRPERTKPKSFVDRGPTSLSPKFRWRPPEVASRSGPARPAQGSGAHGPRPDHWACAAPPDRKYFVTLRPRMRQAADHLCPNPITAESRSPCWPPRSASLRSPGLRSCRPCRRPSASRARPIPPIRPTSPWPTSRPSPKSPPRSTGCWPTPTRPPPAASSTGQTQQEITDFTAANPNATLALPLPKPPATAPLHTFQAVSYEWGVAYAGMLSAAAATGDPRFSDFVAQRFTLFSHALTMFSAAAAADAGGGGRPLPQSRPRADLARTPSMTSGPWPPPSSRRGARASARTCSR